ncbi:hypothetical protein L218DRAFT_1010408 [Marasmius fiardii PR-910]|nr:hypothetical protein L218DRAFT_1010408 [Marasmius fiardii PR-910]
MLRLLEHYAPYPGDEYQWGSTSAHQINVFQLDDKTFEICDLESEQGPIRLPADLLHNPKFQLAAWYVKRQAEELGLSFKDYPKFHQMLGSSVGDAYLEGIRVVLSHGWSLYPPSDDDEDSMSPVDRFKVEIIHDDDNNSWQYLILDCIKEVSKVLDAKCLQDPHFDLVRWWHDAVLEHPVLIAQGLGSKQWKSL